MNDRRKKIKDGELYIPHLLLGIVIVLSTLVFTGLAVHHVTSDLLLSICFPMVMFLIFVRGPRDEG